MELPNRIENEIRHEIRADELNTVADNIGLPTSGINKVYQAPGTVGPQDGDILIGLKEEHHPTAGYVRRLRQKLPQLFPTAAFSFLPADITSPGITRDRQGWAAPRPSLRL